MKRGAADAGWGFVEVLVAMALGLVLVAGAAEMMTLALRAKHRGDIVAALTHAVTDRLESLKARPFDDEALAPGEHEETRRIEPGHSLIVENWEVAEAGAGLKRVRLRAWEAGRPGAATAAVLFVFRDLGFRP